MKHSTVIFVASVMLLSFAKASRYYDMNSNTFSSYPGGRESENREMAALDFRFALCRRNWGRADSIYEDNRLDLLPLEDKLLILKEFILTNDIDAVETIMANFGYIGISDFFVLSAVNSREMLDLMVDDYKLDLNPENTYEVPLEPSTAVLIEEKRQRMAETKEA